MMITQCPCAAFVLLLSYFVPSQGARLVYHNDGGNLPDKLDLMEVYFAEPPVINAVRRSEKGDKNAEVAGRMWFGPRLGRRKRDNGNLREKREDDELTLAQEEALLKLFQNGPWAIISIKGGKRRNVTFTPRLGRESDEMYLDNYMEPSLGGFSRTPTKSGGPVPNTVNSNFTPRLGRLAPQSIDLH